MAQYVKYGKLLTAEQFAQVRLHGTIKYTVENYRALEAHLVKGESVTSLCQSLGGISRQRFYKMCAECLDMHKTLINNVEQLGDGMLRVEVTLPKELAQRVLEIARLNDIDAAKHALSALLPTQQSVLLEHDAESTTDKVKLALVEKMRSVLVELKLTQVEAAQQLEIPQPLISKIMQGKNANISEKKLIECLARLGFETRINSEIIFNINK